MKELKETLQNGLNKRPEIEIGDKKYRLIFNNWVLKNSNLKIDVEKITGITKRDIINKFAEFGTDFIELIITGIKTHIIIKNNDLQAIESGLLCDESQRELSLVKTILEIEKSPPDLISLFTVCINALADFMPQRAEGEGGSPPTLPAERAKK